jgi:hypothetical protein
MPRGRPVYDGRADRPRLHTGEGAARIRRTLGRNHHHSRIHPQPWGAAPHPRLFANSPALRLPCGVGRPPWPAPSWRWECLRTGFTPLRQSAAHATGLVAPRQPAESAAPGRLPPEVRRCRPWTPPVTRLDCRLLLSSSDDRPPHAAGTCLPCAAASRTCGDTHWPQPFRGCPALRATARSMGRALRPSRRIILGTGALLDHERVCHRRNGGQPPDPHPP